MINIEKTVYDKTEKKDGKRILVMRIWPRGVRKDKIDLWLKELGTERELIEAWKQGKVSWAEFRKRYLASLKGKEETLQKLAKEAKTHTLSLLCSCKDVHHCHRILLKQVIEQI